MGETSHGFLMREFKRAGWVLSMDLWQTPDGRSKGIGLVEYGSLAEAQAAVDMLDGLEVDGREMMVEMQDDSRSGASRKGKAPPREQKGYKGGKGSKGSHSVFFHNVLYETTPVFLKRMFRKCGDVVDLDLWTAPDGRSKGTGRVEYGFASEAQDAVRMLSGVEVDGRPMIVEFDKDAKGDRKSKKGAGKHFNMKGKGKR